MTKHIHRTIGIVRFIEKALVNTSAFVLVNDTSTKTPPGGQAPGTPTVFSRVYQMKLDWSGPIEFLNTVVVFTYDIRDNWADFVIHRDPALASEAERGNVRATQDEFMRSLSDMKPPRRPTGMLRKAMTWLGVR